MVENVGSLVHLDHERRVAPCEVVARAHPREDPVDESDVAALCRHPASDLRQQRDQRDLADVGRFASHVWPGHQKNLRVGAAESGVIRHEGLAADCW